MRENRQSKKPLVRLFVAIFVSFGLHAGFLFFLNSLRYFQLQPSAKKPVQALNVAWYLHRDNYPLESNPITLKDSDQKINQPEQVVKTQTPKVQAERELNKELGNASNLPLPAVPLLFSASDELTSPPVLLGQLPNIKAAVGSQDSIEHGVVKLRLIIDRQGKAIFIEVLESNLSTVVIEQIIFDLYSAEYVPGQIDSQPVVAELLIDAEFEY